MSRNTVNLGLVVWDSNSDVFNSVDLANNWDKIDADYNRARPANQAEVRTTVPSSGNFDGRLVYLTVATSGFAAKTLIRFNGSSWGVVGPIEVLSAVPTSSNYAGRVVLLSATASGFAAWTLIRYDGASWASVNNTIDILAAVPGSGNYAGRLVQLTNADSGFKAYDLIQFNGTSWRLIGPQPVAPGTELAYYSQVADASTTNSADPGDTLATFSAATFENVKYYFKIEIPNLQSDTASISVSIRLREGGSNVGNPFQFDLGSVVNMGSVANGSLPFTPTAASHTYSVTWWTSAGTATIKAAGLAPATLKIVKA